MSILRTLTALAATRPSLTADNEEKAVWLERKAALLSAIAAHGGLDVARAQHLIDASLSRADNLRREQKR
ncbi:hypothetical protein [Mycobacterium aquaticum]|uniref:Uncharacterized protein n=1 Tax=Mycobacterium aquaticum TaxID=1927124 RepID=A0A1X0ARY2_9MYCO|nr:hypothetical protein [Mycobacterium aquaticum]ORA32821.1 hypothetical protein BST13_21190 [Mycobacterium aquaticum]